MTAMLYSLGFLIDDVLTQKGVAERFEYSSNVDALFRCRAILIPTTLSDANGNVGRGNAMDTDRPRRRSLAAEVMLPHRPRTPTLRPPIRVRIYESSLEHELQDNQERSI